MRTWTRLIPAVLLVFSMTPAMLRAADPETSTVKDDLQKLLQKVDKLQSDMTANSLRGSQVGEDLRAIRSELSRIRELLERMEHQQGTIQRQAGYGPVGPGIPAGALPPAGTITVQNHYAAPATVRINDRSYRVEPNQTLPIIGVPTGTFQYSVDVEGYGMPEPLRTDVLRPTGYRIRIFPSMPF